jgi:hypothetical protein
MSHIDSLLISSSNIVASFIKMWYEFLVQSPSINPRPLLDSMTGKKKKGNKPVNINVTHHDQT